MRKIPLIAAMIVAGSAASAQVYGANCRGETMSDLARCAAARMPPPETAPVAEEVAPLTSRKVRPSALGGALQPSNLRSAPPVVGSALTPPPMTAGALPGGVVQVDPLANLTRDPTSPFYGLAGSTARRPVLGYDPLSESGIGGFGLPDR
jgi:hypothetical protein